jgi:phosphatidylinositol glycan class T
MTHTVRHGLLASEHPCTENLTPFIALLPCRNKAGIAQLLNPHKLFDANWQKIGIHIDTASAFTLTMVVETVFDPPRTNRMYAHGSGSRDWSFSSLFDRTLTDTCAVAGDTRVDVRLPHGSEDAATLRPLDDWQKMRWADQMVHALELYKGGAVCLPIDVSLRWKDQGALLNELQTLLTPVAAAHLAAEPAVSIKRVMSGYGQERGSIGVLISNPLPTSTSAVWLEELPWWIRLYVHTLSVEIAQPGNHTRRRHDFFDRIHYKPAQDRRSPSLIEATLDLPPHSTIRIMLDFDKAYLRYTEYPPDAHRGFAIPSAILTYAVGARQVRTYSTTSLLPAPLPDFSMPYNVIVLTSTVIALIFGSLFNMMTRDFVAVDLKAVVPKAGKAE